MLRFRYNWFTVTAPNDSALQVFYGTLPLMGAVILAIWNNNARLSELSKRIDDIRITLDKRINDLKSGMDIQFKEIRERLTALERDSRMVY